MATRLTILDNDMRSVLASHGLSRYEDFAETTVGEVVSRSSTTQTWRICWSDPPKGAANSASDAFYLKTYRYKGATRRLALWPDKAGLEARNYRTLRRDCRVDVPDVVAHGSRRRWGYLLDAFILTRAIPHAVCLDDYAKRRWGTSQPSAATKLRHRRLAGGATGGTPGPHLSSQGAKILDDDNTNHCNKEGQGAADGQATATTTVINDPLRRYLLTHTADIVARMHRADFFHIDLQWRNILVADDGSDRPGIFLIDSARGSRRQWKILQAHGRLRDLSSLSKEARSQLTPREHVLWLRRYFGVARLTQEHHAMIRTIQDDRRSKDHNDPR